MTLEERVERDFAPDGELDTIVRYELSRDNSLDDEKKRRKYEDFKELGKLLRKAANIIDKSSEEITLKMMSIEDLTAVVAGYEIATEMMNNALSQTAAMNRTLSKEEALDAIERRKKLLKGYLMQYVESIGVIDATELSKIAKYKEEKSEQGYSDS